MENKFNRNDLISSNSKKDKTYDFQKFQTITSFGRKIYNNYLSLDNALEQEVRSTYSTDIFKESAKSKESVKKKKNTNS